MSAINLSSLNSRFLLTSAQPAARAAGSEQSVALTALMPTPGDANTQSGDPQRDFIRISSSIGRAASSGQLSRQEALEIYRQIANML
jgi:hypothetical protein